MTDEVEYRCFVGNLSWSTSDRGLKAAFEKFGDLLEAKVVIERRSRGFGFVTFAEKQVMEKAIEAMNGIDLDDHNRGHNHDRGREFGRGRGGGGECFKCGKPGHFARECPSDGTSGGRYGGRDDRYGGGGGSRYGPDRNGDRFSDRNRDNGGRGGGDRYSRDRAGPYDRRGGGGY